MPKRIVLDEDTIKQHYLSGDSPAMIAKQFKVGIKTIYNRLQNSHVDMRSNSQSGKLAYCKGRLNIHWDKHPSWNGGRTTQRGYVLYKLKPNDFFYSMADHLGYVKEHRLVIAKYLGRCLNKFELVHHRNGRRDDNRLENLQLITTSNHRGDVTCPFCKRSFAIK